jgi:hypothetical protein
LDPPHRELQGQGLELEFTIKGKYCFWYEKAQLIFKADAKASASSKEF